MLWNAMSVQHKLKPFLKARELKCTQDPKQSPGTCCRGLGIPDDPLSLALFSITSECTLQAQPQQAVPTSHGTGILARNPEEGGRYWVLLQKTWLGSSFVFQGEKGTTDRTLPEETQLQTGKRDWRAWENIDRLVSHVIQQSPLQTGSTCSRLCSLGTQRVAEVLSIINSES